MLNASFLEMQMRLINSVQMARVLVWMRELYCLELHPNIT